VAGDGDRRLGVLTDAGQPTAHLVQALDACDALLLECNHDREMLDRSPYPAFLKRRIGGDYGHLANDASAEILRLLDKSRLKRVIGAHLSQQNNTPELARAAIESVLGRPLATSALPARKKVFPGWTCDQTRVVSFLSGFLRTARNNLFLFSFTCGSFAAHSFPCPVALTRISVGRRQDCQGLGYAVSALSVRWGNQGAARLVGRSDAFWREQRGSRRRDVTA
jgi:hypothetical protein